MGKPLSDDLRSRLVAAVAGGLSRRAAAERFGVSVCRCVGVSEMAREIRTGR